jgi:CheY-like chemotaxis protein
MEAVGQLTGGIAHDLNNILTVITGTIEILAESVADRPELAAIAKMIEEAAARGADLTQRLLAFARKQPLQPREVDVNSLVMEAANLLRPTLGEQTEIHMVLAGDASHALIDPSQLTNAILNLALNARDAMVGGGKLIIETSNVVLDETYAGLNGDVTTGNYVMVAVSDSGHGIPAGILDNVFEPFFTTKDVDKGSGLGLSMVYGFVKQSNGHIKIYSEEGQGTTVRIYLPQATGTARPAELPDTKSLEGGREAILVVEDDHLVRTFVVGQIKSLGYLTLTAVNAAEALIVIDSRREIDLLFTDMIMPGSMNGRQLADAALQRRPELKILFTSGYSNEVIIHHGHLDAGVLLLAKPYRKSDLARMIRAALAA